MRSSRISRSSLRWRKWPKNGINFKRVVYILLIGCMTLLLSVLGIDAYVKHTGSRYIVTPADAPDDVDAILVLGAFVRSDGTVSPILYDRLITALELYRAGKAPKLLLSGDHGQTNYDEVNAMKTFMLERGVDGRDIFMDHAGFSTYESVYRAGEVFQIKRVIIVTQEYHLKRAVFDARKLGLQAYGVHSDRNRYRGMTKFALREIAARNKDFVFATFLKPKPTYLGPAIPINGDGGITDDKPFKQ